MILSFRPLTNPGLLRPLDAPRKPNRFRSSYNATLRLLDEELKLLDASDALAQLVLSDGDAALRLDGALRNDARVGHPGVVLTIVTPEHGTLVYPCDAFESRYLSDPPSWQVNLRAIALGLRDLRRLDDYGITARGQQYAGFRELGSGVALGAGMSRREAAELLAAASALGYGEEWISADALLTADADEIAGAYRDAARHYHPDVQGTGDADVMARLTEARDLLVS